MRLIGRKKDRESASRSRSSKAVMVVCTFDSKGTEYRSFQVFLGKPPQQRKMDQLNNCLAIRFLSYSRASIFSTRYEKTVCMALACRRDLFDIADGSRHTGWDPPNSAAECHQPKPRNPARPYNLTRSPRYGDHQSKLQPNLKCHYAILYLCINQSWR